MVLVLMKNSFLAASFLNFSMKGWFVLLFLVCISCSNNRRTDAFGTDSLVYIKIEKPYIPSLQPLRLSEFVDSIEYVQLEATPECLLPFHINGDELIKTDNLLFIFDLFDILQFDISTGKFIRHIGRVGQGPGEYIQARTIVDTIERKVIVKSPGKKGLLTYDFEGKYLGDISLDDGLDSLFTTCLYSVDFVGIFDENIIFLSEIMPAKQSCQPRELIVYDYKNKKLLYSLPNRMEGKYERFRVSTHGLRVMSKSNGLFFYKSFYNDTLYTINKEGINPYAIIDFGKRKLPANSPFSRLFREEYIGKILITDAYILRDYIYFECQIIKDAQWSDIDRFVCKYDIKTKKLNYYSSIIINDIDGGINLEIRSISTGIIPIPPPDILDKEQTKPYFYTLEKSELKYSELREKFEHMQASRNPDDNPLLMILHLKSDK